MQGKRLLRSRNDRVVAGVAGGIAAMLNIDPLLVRLGFLALGLLNGFGLMVYVVLWLLVPNEDSAAADARSQMRENVGEMQSTAEELMQRVRGMFNS
ncbi:MAG TPA: PspC domain-containing protein [Kouleothrix sp.]|uniref:PspC domain-containing protein n=1 Tax=Kouleothrix sp. TaxID=2779161 RepID=UPI002D00642E|nr:PspC domain-containing protein [Kouleothrix sp.]